MARDPLIDVLRRRTWAGWIDVLLLFVVFAAMSIASGNGHVGTWTSNDGGGFVTHHGVQLTLPVGLSVAWAVIALVYHLIAELATGQSLGKWLMGLKVVKVNGRPLDMAPVLLRTLGRIIDVLPAFYLVGWIAMRGPHRPPQRLGDRLAGTTVVQISHP